MIYICGEINCYIIVCFHCNDVMLLLWIVLSFTRPLFSSQRWLGIKLTDSTKNFYDIDNEEFINTDEFKKNTRPRPKRRGGFFKDPELSINEKITNDNEKFGKNKTYKKEFFDEKESSEYNRLDNMKQRFPRKEYNKAEPELKTEYDFDEKISQEKFSIAFSNDTKYLRVLSKNPVNFVISYRMRKTIMEN